eukprot:1290033-Pyramimonas_sp.AAC.1
MNGYIPVAGTNRGRGERIYPLAVLCLRPEGVTLAVTTARLYCATVLCDGRKACPACARSALSSSATGIYSLAFRDWFPLR